MLNVKYELTIQDKIGAAVTSEVLALDPPELRAKLCVTLAAAVLFFVELSAADSSLVAEPAPHP